MNINDPRAALVKGLHIEPESVTTSKEEFGEYEGEWTARNYKKKFKKRKITVKYNNRLSYTPTSILITNVNYTGTAGLAVVNIKDDKFICTVSGNDSSNIAKVEFNWRTIK
jgi:hypothetical protein